MTRARRAAGAVLPVLTGLGNEAGPLHRQIYLRLRQVILDGQLATGTRLPSTRTLAADLGVSRQTTEEAFAQLDAEGFIVRRVGDGTYVAVLPEGMLASPARARRPTRPKRRSLGRRGAWLALAAGCREPAEVRPFNAGLPALEAFPFGVWQRLWEGRARKSGIELLGYGRPEGYPPLRQAIATYVAAARGVRCDPEQVLVLTSSQQALDLAARLLAEPGDQVWIEDPGYPGARAAFTAAGLRPVAVPVLSTGLDVAAGQSRAPGARLAYVTPSHQYPLGVTLGLPERLSLLEWARKAGACIVEDDYDSEFRFDGRPLASLQGLDDGGRVLYVGTFSKVMFPSLRLSYLIAPADLVPAFANARSLLDGHTSTLPQAVLADFIETGHFATHVRRMRQLYRARWSSLVTALRTHCSDFLTMEHSAAGLHLSVRLSSLSIEREVVHQGLACGLELRPLSAFYARRGQPGLVLAFGGLAPAAIDRGVRALARILARVSGTAPGRRH